MKQAKADAYRKAAAPSIHMAGGRAATTKSIFVSDGEDDGHSSQKFIYQLKIIGVHNGHRCSAVVWSTWTYCNY